MPDISDSTKSLGLPYVKATSYSDFITHVDQTTAFKTCWISVSTCTSSVVTSTLRYTDHGLRWQEPKPKSKARSKQIERIWEVRGRSRALERTWLWLY
jgi:hypothetical protein